MNTLETTTTPLVDIKKEGLKFGGILSAVALLIMFGSWAAGIDTFSTVTMVTTFVPYMIILLLVGGFDVRKRNGGYLKFKEAIQYSFLAYVVVAVVVAIATYILYNFIDPELTQKSFEQGMNFTRNFMEKMGASEADIEKAMADAEGKKESNTSIGTILMGTGLGLIWDFVKALLISLVIRKEKPLM